MTITTTKNESTAKVYILETTCISGENSLQKHNVTDEEMSLVINTMYDDLEEGEVGINNEDEHLFLLQHLLFEFGLNSEIMCNEDYVVCGYCDDVLVCFGNNNEYMCTELLNTHLLNG